MQISALAFIETSLSSLEQSLGGRSAELRNIQLATLSPGGGPGIRTVVLRAFERLPAFAEMHTDARAAKVRDIAHASQVSLLAWSPAAQLQIRLDGSARLHRDDNVTRDRWDKLSPRARNTYGLRAEPGLPIQDPAEQVHLPQEQQFQQFSVIRVSLSNVDILHLDPDGGQTRASGRFTPSGIIASWIGP